MNLKENYKIYANFKVTKDKGFTCNQNYTNKDANEKIINIWTQLKI